MSKITAVIIAIVLTSLVWLVAIEEGRYKNLRAIEKDVWHPTVSIINDLNVTLATGNYELLRKKLQLFNKRWKDYFPDGDTPLIFQKEILKIGIADTPVNATDPPTKH